VYDSIDSAGAGQGRRLALCCAETTRARRMQPHVNTQGACGE